MRLQKLFLTARERQRRIEAVMCQRGLTWYGLSKAMNREQTPVQRAFKVSGDRDPDPRLSSLKALARALGVTVGFLVDVKETKHD